MSKQDRAVIVYGNDTHLNIQMYRFDKSQGKYVDFDMTEVSDLHVYLICSKHSTHINLDYTINDAYHNILNCFIDCRLLHPNAAYGVVVEGIYNEEHFRYEELPSELFLVVSNTSGLKVTDDVSQIDLSARVGWGISVGDLSEYYTKNETNALLDEKADTNDLAQVATTGDYNDLTNKPTIPAAQVQSDWNQTDSSEVDYIKNKPDLSIYATESELSNYYNKGETDGLLNNKVDTSTLTSDYYNKNTVNNLLDSKADNSDLSNYYDKTETNSLLNQKANASDLNDKQDTLVSGTNIKTINNISLLGSGNIDIQGGGGTQVQSNWNETDTAAPSYIQNKPDLSIYAQSSDLSTVATTGDYDDLTNKPDLSIYAQSSDLSTVATSGSYNDLTNKPDLSVYATQSDLTSKQDTLVSGTNIKTINNQSLLGSGNIDIQGGGGENHDNADEATANSLFELNERLSEAEINIDIIPTEVQVKIDELEANVEQSLDELPPKFDDIDNEFKSTALAIDTLKGDKQDTLVSGTNIKTINNNSILGSGNISISAGDTGYDIDIVWHIAQPSDLSTSYNGRLYIDDIVVKQNNAIVWQSRLHPLDFSTISQIFTYINTTYGIGTQFIYNSYQLSGFPSFTKDTRVYYLPIPTTYSGKNIAFGETIIFKHFYNSDSNSAFKQTTIPLVSENTVVSNTFGMHIEVVAALPAPPDANTIYIVT